MTHSDLEVLLEVEGRELLRRLLQAHLDERSPGTVAEPVMGADGRAHTHQRTQTRRLMTIFGEVEMRRMGYGGHGIESLHPLDAALNVPPERYAHGVQHRVAVEAARHAFDDVVATLATTTGAHVPKRQAEQLAARAAQDFETLYDTRHGATPQEAQDTSSVLVLTVDGKGVPMRKGDRREATRQAAEAHPPHVVTDVSRASAPTRNGWRRWRPSLPSGRGCVPPKRLCASCSRRLRSPRRVRARKPSACGLR